MYGTVAPSMIIYLCSYLFEVHVLILITFSSKGKWYYVWYVLNFAPIFTFSHKSDFLKENDFFLLPFYLLLICFE